MGKKARYIYDWPRPMVTTDSVVFAFFRNKPKLLLIKRGNEPYKGKWAIPGGFIEMDEELEDAAARELKEETGLENVPLEQMHTFGTVGRDPRGRQITIVFMGVLPEKPKEIKAGDDAAEAKWFDVDDLPKDMAFDHAEVAQFAIKKLK
jgi:8-oxo-dGTP diphosphatase